MWGLKTAEILLAGRYHKQVCFESGFKEQNSIRISEIGWFQTDGARKLKEHSLNVLVPRFGTLRSFSYNEQKFHLVHMHVVSGKDNL